MTGFQSKRNMAMDKLQEPVLYANHLDLIRAAGFVLWEHEQHGPGPNHVDWSADYDDQLNAVINMTIDRCASIVDHIQMQGGGTLGSLIRKRMNHA